MVCCMVYGSVSEADIPGGKKYYKNITAEKDEGIFRNYIKWCRFKRENVLTIFMRSFSVIVAVSHTVSSSECYSHMRLQRLKRKTLHEIFTYSHMLNEIYFRHWGAPCTATATRTAHTQTTRTRIAWMARGCVIVLIVKMILAKTFATDLFEFVYSSMSTQTN